jgi:hypothetical protein
MHDVKCILQTTESVQLIVTGLPNLEVPFNTAHPAARCSDLTSKQACGAGTPGQVLQAVRQVQQSNTHLCLAGLSLALASQALQLP